jgi:hypothetical protein
VNAFQEKSFRYNSGYKFRLIRRETKQKVENCHFQGITIFFGRKQKYQIYAEGLAFTGLEELQK